KCRAPGRPGAVAAQLSSRLAVRCERPVKGGTGGTGADGRTSHGANPHANGGKVLRDLVLPDLTKYATPGPRPATERHESTGRHGLYVSYEAFAMISASMTVQHVKWREEASRLSWRAPIASLNILLTSTCWRNDHNGFSHQGPGLIDVVLSKQGTVSRVYLPPDANCLLSVADHCLRSRNYVNLIVIDKQPQLQWL